MTYIYPENLKSKATLWLWKIKDLGIFAAFLLFGIFVFARNGASLFIIIAAVYGFLTIQIEDLSIKDFIVYAMQFFVLSEQHFEWRLKGEKQ